MLWIGLTGGMGCGKSTALEILKDLGFGTASADKIVHELYKNPFVQSKIIEELKLENGFDIKEISRKVFNNKTLLKKLEDFIHPLVRNKAEEKRKRLEKEGFKISFYEVPLLFEKKMDKAFNKTLCIGAKEEAYISRIKKRNSWSDEEIKKRLANQLSLEEKEKRADYYIDNSGTKEELYQSLRRLFLFNSSSLTDGSAC